MQNLFLYQWRNCFRFLILYTESIFEIYTWSCVRLSYIGNAGLYFCILRGRVVRAILYLDVYSFKLTPTLQRATKVEKKSGMSNPTKYI